MSVIQKRTLVYSNAKYSVDKVSYTTGATETYYVYNTATPDNKLGTFDNKQDAIDYAEAQLNSATKISVAPKDETQSPVKETNPTKVISGHEAGNLQQGLNRPTSTPPISTGQVGVNTLIKDTNSKIESVCDFTIDMNVDLYTSQMKTYAINWTKRQLSESTWSGSVSTPFSDAIRTIAKQLTNIFDTIKEYFEKIKKFMDEVKKQIDKITALVEYAMKLVAEVRDLVMNCISNLQSSLTNSLSNVSDKVTNGVLSGQTSSENAVTQSINNVAQIQTNNTTAATSLSTVMEMI